jgi:D-aspartate ligase
MTRSAEPQPETGRRRRGPRRDCGRVEWPTRSAAPAASVTTRADGAGAAAPAAACVIGSMDLVRPLGLAGIRCAVVARPGDPARLSRFTSTLIDEREADLVDALEVFARGQREPPVLYYETDEALRFVSGQRERLARSFRFVVPDAAQVETLLDKARFARRAEALGLPVPRSQPVDMRDDVAPDDIGLSFPLVVKAHNRDARWFPLGTSGPGAVSPSYSAKALRVTGRAQLAALWPRLVASGLEMILQEEVAGGESAVESYHAYVDERGRRAGEFTGRKIRTLPARFGFTTALQTTEASDVAAIGRDVLERLRFRGVAKLDFKRAPDGTLFLLEINPRFSLWVHAGAVAGVNLPALVHADASGRPRPPVARARGGVRWCRPLKDLAAARAAGVPIARWLPWMLACEANSAWAWDDPMPVLRGKLLPLAARRMSSGRARTGQGR